MREFGNLKISFVLLLFGIGSFCFGQENLCRTNILDEDEILSENKSEEYLHHDFSTIWTKTENHLVYGIIGEEYQRIHIKLLSVTKNQNNSNEYFVFGKSMVKDNICDFQGKIIIETIQLRKNLNFGVDDELKNEIKNQGIVIASYEFFENKSQTHSGIFEGKLQSKWILDNQNEIQYDDSDLISDGYFNNAFVGTWKSYENDIVKICNWGDYRVPNVDCKFDIGVAEFNVDAEEYALKGWLDIALKNMVSCFEVQETKPPADYVYKEWWE